MLKIYQYDGYILVNCRFYIGSYLSRGQLVVSLSLGQVYDWAHCQESVVVLNIPVGVLR